MFFWYGFQNQPRSNIRVFNRIFFSINSRSINNIIVPHNLQELVNNIKLKDSEYFCTLEVLIKRMTIIPFYSPFLNKTEKKKVYDSLVHNGPVNITKSLLGLKSLNCKALDFKLKFCYQCWMENNYMYFDIEHQVKDNYICYKHNTRLQYININSSDYFLLDNNINKYIEAPYCISQNDEFLLCHTQVSSMIHDIFINGFGDDIIKLKSKIRMKILDLGYMREDFNFINRFDELWSCYAKYNLLNIDKVEFINVIYSTTNNPNPISYLTLINYLFGSLKLYNEYEIDEQYIKIISQKPSKVISLTQPLKACGFIYYKDLMLRLYSNQYSIVKKVEKHYEIKCNLCNHEWIIPQYYISSYLVHCPICDKRKRVKNSSINKDNQQASHFPDKF